MQGRPLTARGVALPYPAVCAPLVARTAEALLAECRAVAAKKPDLIEWRVDFFDAIGDAKQVIAAARRLKTAAGGLPVLFTRRNAREGGEKIAIGEPQVVDLYREVCASGLVDLVDFEMDNDAAHVQAVRDAARAAGLPLVMSFHDFQATPPADALVRRFERARSLGADVAKIAVMPHSMDDVLALLGATARASRDVTIPLVSMAMGPLGAVTRTNGWLFGSAMTFAVGASSSAPGQMAIEDVRSSIEIMRKAMSPRT
jgi:3-dehydroquinate dehydratase-1